MISNRPATTVPRSPVPGPEISGFAVGLRAQLVGYAAFAVCLGVGFFFADRAADARSFSDPFVGLWEVVVGFVVGAVVGVLAMVALITAGVRPATRVPSWRVAMSVFGAVVAFGLITLGVGLLVAGPVIGAAAQQVLAGRTSAASRLVAVAGGVIIVVVTLALVGPASF